MTKRDAPFADDSPRKSRSRAAIMAALSALTLLLCVLGGVAGCAGPHVAAPSPKGQATAVTSSPQRLDLDVVVRPHPGGNEPRWEIELAARADDLPRRFVVQKSWAGEESVIGRLGDVRGTCDGMPAPLERQDLGTHVGFMFPIQCADAKLTYTIDAAPEGLAWGNEYDAVVTPSFASAIAETALVLPDVPDDTRARIELYFDLSEMPGDVDGVYSLGPGLHETTTRALRHSYFAAGTFVTLHAQAGSLDLEARFAGPIRFDLQAAMSDLNALLAAEASLFQGDPGGKLRLLVVGMPHQVTSIDALDADASDIMHGTSLTESAALWVDGGATWGQAEARLAAHEMFHLYNGQVIRRAPPDARTYWFSEGFTEYYADELMLRARITTPAQWLAAVRRRVRDYHALDSVLMPDERADLGFGGADEELPYLRGSLVAAYLDYALRSRNDGGRSLDTVMGQLVHRARLGASPLDTSSALDIFGEHIDEASLHAIRRVIIDGDRIVLPADTFGACVEVVGEGTSTDVKVRDGVDLDLCMNTGR